MKHLSQAIGSAEFINIVPINPLISKCQIKVCWVGQTPNRNKTVITKEVATKMAASLPGSPIVGFYSEEKKDFLGHEEEMVITDKEIYFKSVTQPYGFVDINAKVWFQWFLDDGKYEREYLVTEGYIWTGRYPEARRIISEGNNQSMELDKKSVSGVWTKDNNNKPQFFIINEANISALCTLGEDIEPCFEGSQVASEFALNEDFVNTFRQMAKELKQILSEGGNIMNENTEQITTEEVVVEEVTETAVTEETSVEEVIEENSNVEEENVENEGQNSETETEENLENNEGNFSENSEEEVEESETEESEQSTYSLDEIPEYVQLRQDYALLEERFNSLEAEIKPLRTFKLEAERVEKENLIKKFYMLSDEDKKDVVENIDTYSLDEIESRLAVVCFRNKVSFNLEEEEEIEESLTYNLNSSTDEFDNAPDWVKAVRATRENNI